LLKRLLSFCKHLRTFKLTASNWHNERSPKPHQTWGCSVFTFKQGPIKIITTLLHEETSHCSFCEGSGNCSIIMSLSLQKYCPLRPQSRERERKRRRVWGVWWERSETRERDVESVVLTS
uniref:Uncharacterized protein n=1 Tax=Periophthalmus magnuspinnatus TaxID=409849 RepID=A0A3B3ZZS5_9GOBI